MENVSIDEDKVRALIKIVEFFLESVILGEKRRYCIRIECISYYYDHSRVCFEIKPYDPGKRRLMRAYAMLKHLLECPYPLECPTSRRVLKAFKYRLVKH